MDLTDEQRAIAIQRLTEKIAFQQSLLPADASKAGILDQTKITVLNFYMDWIKKFGIQYQTLDTAQKADARRFFDIVINAE
jgi:hypothetical protein